VLKGSFAICQYTASATKLGAFCLRGFRALVLACFFFIPDICPATAAPDADIRAFVERVNQASTDLLSSEEKADERCHSLLGWAFDVPAMAQYALGRAWEQSTSAEREEFLAAFEGAIVTAYLRRMRDYRGATMSFVGVRPSIGGDRMAASRLRLPDAEETWIWRLRPSGQSWRIVDVAIDGSSVLSSERQEYAEILAANHGDINAVTAFIRKRADRGS
jgi:phospholipid transport system substrate-binding protein